MLLATGWHCNWFWLEKAKVYTCVFPLCLAFNWFWPTLWTNQRDHTYVHSVVSLRMRLPSLARLKLFSINVQTLYSYIVRESTYLHIMHASVRCFHFLLWGDTCFSYWIVVVMCPAVLLCVVFTTPRSLPALCTTPRRGGLRFGTAR